MEQPKVKPIWDSLTIRGAVAGLGAFFAIAIPFMQPDLVALASDGQTSEEWINLIVKLALLAGGASGTAASVAGRVRVGDIYTPHGIPGPNKEDLLGSLMRGADDAAASFGDANPND